MKTTKFIAFCAMVSIVLSSCQKEEILEESELESSVSVSLSKEHITALIDAGVNPSGAYYETHSDLLTGKTREGIRVSDLFIDLEKLAELKLAVSEDGTKQYRTSNLVTAGSTINVLGYTGSGYALSSVMQTGLARAIANLNNANTSLTFNLTFGTTGTPDILIYNPPGTDSSAGGVAEFPSGGNPGYEIQIFGGMNNYDADVNEHVMTHEIGHALGFRHTDYARRRCDNSNEGSTSYGAIYIPGTPSANQWGSSSIDTDSIMISCFSGDEDGEFSYYDLVALNYMY